MRYVNRKFVFAYPSEFTTLPEYSKRRGQIVTVTRRATKEESDFLMYHVRADDGWTGIAWPDELSPMPG